MDACSCAIIQYRSSFCLEAKEPDFPHFWREAHVHHRVELTSRLRICGTLFGFHVSQPEPSIRALCVLDCILSTSRGSGGVLDLKAHQRLVSGSTAEDFKRQVGGEVNGMNLGRELSIRGRW